MRVFQVGNQARFVAKVELAQKNVLLELGN